MTEPATATPKQPADARPATAGEQAGRAVPRTGWLAFATLVGLLAALLINRVSLSGGAGDYNIVLAATALPLLVQASVLAGTAVGLWAVTRAATWRPALGGRLPRLGVGLLAGLLTGGLASGAVLIAYGIPADVATVLAVCAALAGGIGGLLGTLRPSLVLAGVCAGLAVMVIEWAVSLYNRQLLGLFGGDVGSPADKLAASGLLAGATALVMGLVAGVVGYQVLRRVSRGLGESPRWPAYLIAGGSAAFMLVLAEIFSRVGVPVLLSMAAEDVTFDRLIKAMEAGSRLNTLIVVFFVGAVTAIIAFGRTLPKRAA
jgi:hypothetical protein